MNTQQNILNFISKATSPFHVVKAVTSKLAECGYLEIDFQKDWSLEKGKSYYCNIFDTTLFAFTIPNTINENSMFRITASHTDHPCFRIKPNSDVREKGYHKINVEPYGGVILNTWLDRPLSVAGKITLKSTDIFHPKTRIFDLQKPVFTIPNLAIHMNRQVNQGIELNKQVHMQPLFALENEDIDFIDYIAKELNIEANDILDYDMYIYNCEEGCTLGYQDCMISSPRLDNLTSVFAQAEALCKVSSSTNDFNFAIFYDNEEIGSKTKQGADSMLTTLFLKKVLEACNINPETLNTMLFNSIMISSDVAHALHPNYSEKYDTTNVTHFNEGIVIKINYNQKYATDTEAIGIVQQLCINNNIPYQKFVNRSDQPGGSTLGSISSAWLPMRTIDIGIPILAMHSSRELCGGKDIESMINLFVAFYGYTN